jgi:hypothetical protein
MDKVAIAQRLRALASDDNRRSKTARLRDVLDDVETALAAGVPRSAVLETLAQHGLDMTLATFETTLRRLRRKRAGPAISAAPSQPAGTPLAGAAPPPPPPKTGTPSLGSHNPADLDAIMGSTPDLAALEKIGKRKPSK